MGTKKHFICLFHGKQLRKKKTHLHFRNTRPGQKSRKEKYLKFFNKYVYYKLYGKKSYKNPPKLLFNSELLSIFIQVLIEQERAVINQRRMYEGNIADLEKALYDKTKEAEAAVNSAQNREWRITVKRMLEHDIEANSRLSNKLNKAMELVSTLEVITG